MSERILILGGTYEARTLANRLSDETNHMIITSLAGRTDNPTLPNSDVRIGGFGGVDGLTQYLKEHDITLLVDAVHPFAARISIHAFDAANAAKVKLIRIERPPWKPDSGDHWHNVPSLEDAVAVLPEKATVFVTIGRQQLGAFLERQDITVVARAIEGPKIEIPSNWTMILAQPPFTLEEECALFEEHGIDYLITKNAGGSETREKLLAARQLKKPVIMIDRLPKPQARTFSDVAYFLKHLNTTD